MQFKCEQDCWAKKFYRAAWFRWHLLLLFVVPPMLPTPVCFRHGFPVETGLKTPSAFCGSPPKDLHDDSLLLLPDRSVRMQAVSLLLHLNSALKNVHIIVSRQDRTRRIKLSPLANSKKLFSRENFKLSSCKHFDDNYKYQGSGKELERHIAMREGSVQEKEDYFMKEYERIKAPPYTTGTGDNQDEEKKKAKKKIKSRNRNLQ